MQRMCAEMATILRSADDTIEQVNYYKERLLACDVEEDAIYCVNEIAKPIYLMVPAIARMMRVIKHPLPNDWVPPTEEQIEAFYKEVREKLLGVKIYTDEWDARFDDILDRYNVIKKNTHGVYAKSATKELLAKEFQVEPKRETSRADRRSYTIITEKH